MRKASCRWSLKPGQRAVTCDKAAGAAGAIGAQVTCADPTQLKQVLETGELLLEEPENGALKETVKLTGKLPEGLSAKDLALSLVKELGAENLAGKLLSLTGDTLEDMELSEKMVLCGVLEKAGATAVTVEKEAEEKTDVVFDAAQTKELTAFPGGYKEFAALEELPVTDVKSVFIGGTTGGNLKDLETVSSMLKGRKIAYGLRLVVAPSDADTYIKAATAGYITDILEAGGIVINHCGNPEVQGRIGKTEVMVSNDLENKPGYAGFDTSKTYLTSTKAAVEAALLGTLGYKEEAPAAEEEPEEEAAAPAPAAPVAAAPVAGGTLKIHIGEGKDIDLEIPVGALGAGGAAAVPVPAGAEAAVAGAAPAAAEEEKVVRSVTRKHYKITEVKRGPETKIEGTTLYIREGIEAEVIANQELVKDFHLEIITPDKYHTYSETIMDVQPIATKEGDSDLGTV